ncbi:hypothetical protein D4764_14G0003220 [Takifugu flavidus]|uniref:Helix-turn-helix domain-containing protein n=1 Tax=Takifugu flavidus TaxID=433684 RepID=A0A5C6P694_9TELE|nr:hypothetical protein D4764_14G0003220 [Takifugu flavidus]
MVTLLEYTCCSCACNSIKAHERTFKKIAVKITEDRNLTIEVYRKPTHTNQYLQFDSHHPLEHKLGVIKTLQHRAKKTSRKRDPSKEEEEKDKGHSVSIPYLSGVSEKLRRILQKHDIPVQFNQATLSDRDWLDYCNSLLSGCPNNSLRSLQLIQNAAARVLTGIDKRDHITPVLASLHWLPVKFRINVKTLLLTYKVLRGLAPSYLEELVIPYQPNRPLRSQNAGLLVVPRVSRSRMGGRAFSYQAPLLWNQLPVQVREADSIATFKIRLKTFLFEKAYCY